MSITDRVHLLTRCLRLEARAFKAEQALIDAVKLARALRRESRATRRKGLR